MGNKFIKKGDAITHPSTDLRFTDNSQLLAALTTAQPSFTAAHITDLHFMDTAICNARMPVFKASLQSKQFECIFNTGDSIENSASYVSIYDAFKSGITQPIYAVRGNHDYGATNAQLGITANYYFADIGAKWRIITLYSQGGGNYSLGATQTAWLSALLASTPTDRNICILIHVPVVSVAAMMYYVHEYNLNPVTSSVWNPTVDHHRDILGIVELFRQYPKVKVVLSGHEHIWDDVTYLGVRYLCGGAVSANWWRDTSYQIYYSKAGYSIIQFFDDGTVSREIIYY